MQYIGNPLSLKENPQEMKWLNQKSGDLAPPFI